MRKVSLPLSLLSLLLFLDCSANAVKVPFEVAINSREPSPNRLAPRANPIPIENKGNAQYISNITIAGVGLRVLLDTGSSDLWVNFPGQIPSTTDLGKQVSLSYAIGKASGNVHSAKVDFGTHSVNDQAFLLVTDTSTFASDIHSQGYDGLLGLGPNDASSIRDEVDSAAGDTFLQKLFQQQGSSTGNFITFLLDRKGDPTDPFTGQFTISETVDQYNNVTNMPKLDVEMVHKLLDAEQHWQALTDKDIGLIGPDGTSIAPSSIVPKAPDGQLVAVFDSGFTFSQVPRDVSDAIYGRVKGATYDTNEEMWLVPCGQLLNITFHFGGMAYPIHPLDAVDDNFGKTDANGNRICIGSFQPITTAFSIFGNFDMILGMSFLRNTYTLMDYGNWIDDSKSSQGSPYIQLLPVTDANTARQEFIQTRLGGQDTTGDDKWQLLPPDQMQHSPVSAEEKKKLYQEKILSRWPYILVGCLVGVGLIVGFCVWRCCCRRGAKKGKLFNKKAASTAYLPLQTPAGAGHHHAGGAFSGHHHAG